MTRYVLSRLAAAVPTLFGIVVLVFLLVHLAPGSPVTSLGGEGGRRVTGQAAVEMRRLYGLDRPLPERFGLWLGRVARLDLGESFVDHRPVGARILEALPYTLALNGVALLLTFAIAIPLGVAAGGRAEGLFDRTSGVVLFALYSMPTFWAALLLQALFSVRLRWLPLFGVAEAMTQDYVLAARARGASRRRALWAHALPNALLPIVTLLGLIMPGLLSGSVIVERIFAWPGLGRLYFDAILSRDYPVVLGLSLLGAVATLLCSLAADVASAAADPRVRDGTAS
jgi:peptide/nickel transport system permease protein